MTKREQSLVCFQNDLELHDLKVPDLQEIKVISAALIKQLGEFIDIFVHLIVVFSLGW